MHPSLINHDSKSWVSPSIILSRLSKVVGVEGPSMTAVYLYDASDRRVTSQVNGYATNFVLEGDRVLQEVDGNSAQVTKDYVWGAAIDELVILQTDGEIYHAHADALGSTALLTDATGEVVERYDYNPFGACVATDVNGGGLVGNPYRFTGRRLDTKTGLYYYRARYYSTELSRFLSRDPIGNWGDPGNFGNAYAYAGNNPLSYTDPFGLEIRENLVASFSELRDIMTTELNLLKLENNKDSIDADNFLEHLAMNKFATYDSSSKGRFVYTNEKGYLDMKHVLKAAESVRSFYISSGMVLAHGERIEAKQAENGSPSGWGVEDLPSNLAGVVFAEKGFETGKEVIASLMSFLNDNCGGESLPPATASEFNNVRNFGYEPVLDPNSDTVKESEDDIKYLSSGKDKIDKKRLDQLRKTKDNKKDKSDSP